MQTRWDQVAKKKYINMNASGLFYTAFKKWIFENRNFSTIHYSTMY